MKINLSRVVKDNFLKGQSLLEVTIFMSLVAVIVLALTVTTLNGLGNSQFAKNQTQATKLGQSTVDVIRTLRSKNCKTTLNSASTPTDYYWYAPGSGELLIWSAGLSATQVRAFISAAGSCGGITDQNPIEKNGIFTRTTTLTNSTADQIIVNVSVTWKDISGNRESKIVTVLSNN